MQVVRSAAIASFLAIIPCNSQATGTVTVHIALSPESNAAPPTIALDFSEAGASKPQLVTQDPGKASFTVDLSVADTSKQAILRGLSASLGPVPNDYSVGPVTWLVPFPDYDSQFDIFVSPTIGTGSATTARELFARDLSGMNTRELFEFYWTARAESAKRIGSNIANPAEPIGPRDIQVAYKLLQAVRELSYKMGYMPDDLVVKTAAWLRAKQGANPEVVKKAQLRPADVSTLLMEINQLEAHALGNVWSAILKVTDCPERYRLLSAFRHYVNSKPTQERGELLSAIRLTEAEIVLSQNACTQDAAAAQPDGDQVVREQIATIKSLQGIANPANAQRLQKDLDFFENIVR